MSKLEPVGPRLGMLGYKMVDMRAYIVEYKQGCHHIGEDNYHHRKNRLGHMRDCIVAYRLGCKQVGRRFGRLVCTGVRSQACIVGCMLGAR